MNLIKNFLGLFVAITFLASCGSETAKETVEPKVEEIVEKKIEEFDVRAVLGWIPVSIAYCNLNY